MYSVGGIADAVTCWSDAGGCCVFASVGAGAAGAASCDEAMAGSTGCTLGVMGLYAGATGEGASCDDDDGG